MGGGPDGGYCALNVWGISWGRLGLAAGSVCQWGRTGAIMGSPGRARAQPQCGIPGAQAKPRGWASSSLTIYTPRSTSQPKHSAICLVGQLVAGWPRTWGQALLSCHLLTFGVECTGGSWTTRLPIDMEGLDLFLRQSCSLILDVFPEAYFS